MSTENYITASCVISDFIVYKNGSILFENSHTDLPGFLVSAYQHFNLIYPQFYKMDNLSKLGLLASEVLLKPGFLGHLQCHRLSISGVVVDGDRDIHGVMLGNAQGKINIYKEVLEYLYP